MALEVEAIYENGVLRPLQPLGLKEHERVFVSLVRRTPDSDGPQLAVAYIERIKRELKDTGPVPTLEEVQRRLSKIPGSMADAIIADREER